MSAVLLALGASVCWGLGDLVAGLMSRRGSAASVTLASQGSGLIVALVLVFVLGRAWPGWQALFPALLAGLALSVGTIAYFRALAIGTISVIAPITATCAVVPAVAGVLQGERPSLLQIGGVVAALAGIVLASREPQATPIPAGPPEALAVGAGVQVPRPGRRTNRSSIGLAVLAAACFGLVLLGLAETAKHDPFYSPLAARACSTVLLAVLFLARGGRLRLPRPALAGALGAGVFHVSAATLFSLATARGYLSLVSVLSSLSAVFVVGIAHLLLRERLVLVQRIGVLAALVGVIAIVAG